MDNTENNEKDEFIKIERRPWYQWVLWAFWVFLEIIFFQAAVASGKEFEPRAAMVFWLIFGVLLLGGIILWIIRRQRLI